MNIFHHYATLVIYYAIIILGSLAILSGILWLGLDLFGKIFRHLQVYEAVIEFLWDRARRKNKSKKSDK